ncbi:hypothetical protein BYT27DRAFT_7182132 [Phlegmacium glaucopus]|nr:hypothetical protein BYT27DRAFT_7182132 [Phlegmacium glaucopus]
MSPGLICFQVVLLPTKSNAAFSARSFERIIYNSQLVLGSYKVAIGLRTNNRVGCPSRLSCDSFDDPYGRV